MAQRVRIANWGRGINKDQSPWELEAGFWSDCQNARFRNQNAERVGGVAVVLTPMVVPYYLVPYSSGQTPYVVYAGLQKVYMHDGSTESDITRGPLPQTVVACVVTGPIATLETTAPHALVTGDRITTAGFNLSSCNAENVVITVTDSTHFTFATTGLSGTGTGGNYIVVTTTGADTLFTGTQDDKWTGGNFNGALVLNNPVDGMYYLDQNYTPYRLRQFQDIRNDTFYFARPFKNFIVYGGQTTGGTLYRHRFGWSDTAAAGSVPAHWTAADTNLAGDVDLPSEGEMVDAWPWGEDLIVYKRDVRYRARFIGGNDVFDFQFISGNNKDDGLLAAGCVANTPAGQVFITDGLDIRIHTGGESRSIAYGKVLKYFRGAIDPTYRKRSFVTVNPYTNEACIYFPESGQTNCSKCLLWNWEEDTWGLRDATNTTAGAAGELPTTLATSPRLLVANTTPKIGLVDSGTTYFGASYQTMFERQGIDFDTPDFKTLSESMPRFNAAGVFTASIYHGSSLTQDGPVTYTPAQTYTHNTTRRITALANSGAYGAWKMTMTPSDTPTLKSIDFWVIPDGEW